jgi:hypothetical protein
VEELLKAGGWVFLRTGKHKGHRRDIGFGRTQNVSVALTPSDVRSFQNLRSRLKRLDEERDAWQQEKRAEGELQHKEQWQKQQAKSKAQCGKTETKPPLLAVRNARHGLPLGA